MNTSPIFSRYLLLCLSSLCDSTLRVSSSSTVTCDVSVRYLCLFLYLVVVLMAVAAASAFSLSCFRSIVENFHCYTFFHLMFVLCYSWCWEHFHCPSRAHSLWYYQRFHCQKHECSGCSIFVENANVHCLPVYMKQVTEVVYYFILLPLYFCCFFINPFVPFVIFCFCFFLENKEFTVLCNTEVVDFFRRLICWVN